jgi:hypothetical protein
MYFSRYHSSSVRFTVASPIHLCLGFPTALSLLINNSATSVVRWNTITRQRYSEKRSRAGYRAVCILLLHHGGTLLITKHGPDCPAHKQNKKVGSREVTKQLSVAAFSSTSDVTINNVAAHSKQFDMRGQGLRILPHVAPSGLRECIPSAQRTGPFWRAKFVQISVLSR